MYNTSMTNTFRWTPNGNEVFQSDLEHIPDFCYHFTPCDRVSSILKHGLLQGSPRTSKEGTPRGVYLIADPSFLLDDGMDDFSDGVILKVDISSFKLKLRPDPEWRSSDHDDPLHSVDDIAWFVDFNIDPYFIQVQDKK